MTIAQSTSKLLSLKHLNVQPSSVAALDDAEFALARPADSQGQNPPAQIVILAPRGSSIFSRFEGTSSDEGDQTLLTSPTSTHNLEALRTCFPWLRARP